MENRNRPRQPLNKTNFYYTGCGQKFKLISEDNDRPSLEKVNTDEEEIKPMKMS